MFVFPNKKILVWRWKMSMKLKSPKEFFETCILHTLSSRQIMIDFTTWSYIYTYIYI
jgi:hypothetical protein